MNIENITPASAIIIHFYAQCFAFPYEEMNYELQHIYRRLESEELTDDEYLFVEQILSVINVYQGEEIQDLRNEYVSLFTTQQGPHPRCPMIASDFMRLTMQPYDATDAEDAILESAIPINPDEPVDSVINYLQYFSFLISEYCFDQSMSSELILFYKEHVLSWIPQLCDTLYRSAGLSFYKEFAVTLKEYILSFETEY